MITRRAEKKENQTGGKEDSDEIIVPQKKTPFLRRRTNALIRNRANGGKKKGHTRSEDLLGGIRKSEEGEEKGDLAPAQGKKTIEGL